MQTRKCQLTISQINSKWLQRKRQKPYCSTIVSLVVIQIGIRFLFYPTTINQQFIALYVYYFLQELYCVFCSEKITYFYQTLSKGLSNYVTMTSILHYANVSIGQRYVIRRCIISETSKNDFPNLTLNYHSNIAVGQECPIMDGSRHQCISKDLTIYHLIYSFLNF